MNKTLILDSSYKDLVVGLAIDFKIIDSIKYECFQRQSEFMVQEIDNILKRNNLKAKDITQIVVTKGPGSYTGLRIALTISKVYGLALNIDVYLVSSLEALKVIDKPTICLMNARSNRSYIGIYLNDKKILEDTILKNEEVLEIIKKNEDYLISGDVSYLDLNEEEKERVVQNDIFLTMLSLIKDENKVQDILTLKATYMKEEYGSN